MNLIAIILILIPAVLGGIAFNRCFRGKGKASTVILTIIGAVLPNLFSYVLLWFVLGTLDYSITSTRLKIGFCLIALLFVGGIFLVVRSKDHIAKVWATDTLFACISVPAFAAFTYLIYIPSVMILSNTQEFRINFIDAFVIFLVETIVFLAISFLICFALRKVLGKDNKICDVLCLILFYIGFAIYIQFNFLNGHLPELSGVPVDWSKYRSKGIIGAVVLLAVLVVLIICYIWMRRIRFGQMLAVISVSLCVMQLVSLLFTFRGYFTNLTIDRVAYSKDGEFEIGNDNNVVVFVVDTLDAGHVDRFLDSDIYKGELEDFDYFDNVVGGGYGTTLGGPVLFSGVEYDLGHSYPSYMQWVVSDNILDSYKTNGYNIRLFSNGYMGKYETENYMPDAPTIGDTAGFAVKDNKMVNYASVPYFAKKYFYMPQDELMRTFSAGTNVYSWENFDFYNDLLSHGKLETLSGRCLRIIHLRGVHPLYSNDSDCKETEPSDVYSDEVFSGVMLEITTYMDYLKKEGLYDSTDVLILGDHGCNFLFEQKGCRPAVLVKLSSGKRNLRDECSCLEKRDGVSAIVRGQCAGWNTSNLLRELAGDHIHGMTLYDTSEQLRMERKQAYSWPPDFDRYRIVAETDADFNSLNSENVYELYDSSIVNTIHYSMTRDGNILEMKTDQGDELQGIKSNGKTATCAYETVFNFELADYSGGDIELTAKTDDIYGDDQKIVFFAGNSFYTTVNLIRSDHEGFSFVIPKEAVRDNKLFVRMVCPYAQVVSDAGTDSVASVDYNSIELSEIVPDK